MKKSKTYWFLTLILLAWSCGSEGEQRIENGSPDSFRLFQLLPAEKSNLFFENKILENNRINILNYLYYYNGAGVAAGDINNDGLPDLYFAATVGRNKLFLNKGNMTFEEVASSAGVDGGFGITTGVNFIDINNDGYLDIYVCKSGAHSERYRTNQLFVNNGDLTFQNMGEQWGDWKASCSNGATYADLDMDGDLDVVVNNLNEPSAIYENLSAANLPNNFLKVKLTGSSQNRNAIGASVVISYGDQKQRADMSPTRGYLSSVDHILHFGLGTSKKVDLIAIAWPDGKTTQLKNPKINRVLKVKYASSDLAEPAQVSKTKPLFEDISLSSGLNHRHEEIAYDDFAREILLPHKLSENGPFLSVADVNQDGLDDFFIGGSAGKEAALYLQNADGKFSKSSREAWILDKQYEDQRSVFFDADQDGDPDLYVVSGSNEFDREELYQDRLYLNDGKGNFERSPNSLPKITASGMAVDAGDYDGDGDLDLAVGGRVVPGKYPSPPQSYLLENRNGIFVDVASEIAPSLRRLGMITDLEFSDYDQDEDPDLIAAGNFFATETETIRYDAGSGLCLLNDGEGNFASLPNCESGLLLKEDVRDIKLIQLANGDAGLLVANNKDVLRLLRIRSGSLTNSVF